MRWEVIRGNRAARPVGAGAIVYRGHDYYGCASDDTRRTGIEHVSVSLDSHGEPFFTIPLEDLKPVSQKSTGEK